MLPLKKIGSSRATPGGLRFFSTPFAIFSHAVALVVVLAATVFVALGAPVTAWATGSSFEVEFYAIADRERMALDDTLNLTVTLTVDSGKSEEVLVLPEVAPDFRVVKQSQSEQNSFRLVGSSKPTIRRTRVFNFTLVPTKQGKLTIPSGVLRLNGKKYETAPIQIVVSGASTSSRSQDRQDRLGRQGGKSPGSNDPLEEDDEDDSTSKRRGGRSNRGQAPSSPFAAAGMPDPFAGLADLGGLMDDDDLATLEQLFGMGGRMGQERRKSELQDSDLFVRAVLDKKKAYVGEQITMSIILYARTDVSGVSGMKMPKLDGFWAEDIESPSQITGERRVIDGVAYRAFLLRRKALFPLKAGTLTIDSVEADIDTNLGFFFSGGRKVQRKSAPITVQVLPLPKNPPKGFESSNVGSWKLSADANPSTVQLGQPITLRLTLEGSGNLRNIMPPQLPAIDGLKAYEPTSTERITTAKNRFGGRKSFEYLLMPSRVGQFTLPELEFTFFDPAQKKYQTIRTKAQSLKVTSGTGQTLPLPSLTTDTALQAATPAAFNVLDATGLKPLRYKGDVRRPQKALLKNPWFPPLAAFPLFLWMLLTVITGAKSALAAGKRSNSKERGAGRRLKNRLKKSKSLIAAKNADGFYAEVADALNTYISERSGKSASGMTRPELKAFLKESGVSDEICEQFSKTLDVCDAGRFAPGASEEITMNQVLEDALNVLHVLESAKLGEMGEEG